MAPLSALHTSLIEDPESVPYQNAKTLVALADFVTDDIPRSRMGFFGERTIA